MTTVTKAKRVLSANHFTKIVLSSIKETKGCKECFETLYSNKQNDNTQILKAAQVENTEVIADADYFERGYSRGMQLLERKLPSIGFQPYLRQSLKDALNPLDFEWVKCDRHRLLIKHSFKKNLVLNFINNWTIYLNQILVGQIAFKTGNLSEKEARRQYLSSLKRTSGIENCKYLF